MPAAPLLILLPAAGSSSRMGPSRDKLTEDLDGEPLLRNRARLALATGLPVLVTLPPDRPARLDALSGLAVDVVFPEGVRDGMSASLRAGAAEAAGRGLALMVLPADMPELTLPDLQRLLAAFVADPSRIHRGASADLRPGHPVILPADLLPEALRLTGDQGAKPLLQAHPARITLHPLPGTHALTDLDTPEAWEAWRAQRTPAGSTSG
ncbi:nucleotidyltransferase family protein [Falsigemmobacter faecalis]|uniref:Nucleotidyltransferase family protein n=1 Tax=Falsigemmobacter faecalis TaxID=2488730 RepID=A0A3P3DKL8_9RHOB|nr:nucleotidyltransferase family protein [Falsigemmobacter faecalis]RRH74797.1 nucleotidyltransferase family protein [Falsigemmobacter faecalis]